MENSITFIYNHSASLVVGIIGTAGMMATYPLYRYLSKVAKAE